MGRRLIVALTLALLALASAAGPAPRDFQTVDVFGEPLRLTDFGGQWVVVNFWATWCEPCRREIPELSALHRERADVALIGLAFEEIDPADIRQFLEEYPASYPIALVDLYQPPEHFGIPRVLPTTVLLGPDGKRRRTFLGPVTRAMIETEIALVSQQTRSVGEPDSAATGQAEAH